jgi:hypothetical protein
MKFQLRDSTIDLVAYINLLLLHKHLIAVHYLFVSELIEALLAGHGEHGRLQNFAGLVHLHLILLVLHDELLEERAQMRLLAVYLVDHLSQSLRSHSHQHRLQLHIDALVIVLIRFFLEFLLHVNG